MKISKEATSLAGEFYTVAQLFQHGFVATPTLGKTKHVDILVYNPTTGNRTLVEVKTTHEEKASIKTRLFGHNYEWIMNKKHEGIEAPHIFYCFVLLREDKKLPRFFIVPSSHVAHYVKWEHQHWLEYRKRRIKERMKKEHIERIRYRGKELTFDEIMERIDGPMRAFRISVDSSEKYEDKWNTLS